MLTVLFALTGVVLMMALVGYGLSWLAEPATRPRAARDQAVDPVAAQATRTSGSLKELELVEELNRRLPQTQCAQCGYPGCRPYATAIIHDNAPINQCPPGGDALITELADFLGVDPLPLDDENGQTKPAQVALIIEPDCIGCTLCISACPVDAIVGAQKYMHTVIASHCTGCELCLAPCPVDCIELHPVPVPLHRWQWPKPS